MAVNITHNGGITIIDPNPDGTNVNHEDLMVYVRLLARTKSRSILTVADEQVIQLEAELKNVPSQTNYTYQAGSKTLTTDWTNVGGHNVQGGTDFGTFGITSINIDVKSSFIPQVTVDFVDIRGATLFEQGPCSPYAAFFHMPYPVFELTVKGFYGRPVTYILALRKFNTKFNSSTGNFEVKAEFIGYTYAFLADLVMGYALAAPYMPGAEDKLKSIWEKTIESNNNYIISELYSSPESNNNKLPTEPVTLRKMLEDIGRLEKKLGELANTDEFQDLAKLNILKSESAKLNDIITNFQNDVRELNVDVEYIDSEYTSGGKTKMMVAQKSVTGSTSSTNGLIKLVENYFGTNQSSPLGMYEATLGSVNAIQVRQDYGIAEIPKVPDTIVQKGLYVKDKTLLDSGGEKYYMIDLGKSFKEPLSVFNKEVDTIIDTHQTKLKGYVNQAVEDTLGYVPTVRNVMCIILANMELFLHLLVEASCNAEDIHKRENIPAKDNGLLGDGTFNTPAIYPWPTYYEKDTTVGGDVEKFPGVQSKFFEWAEVKFVEDYITAYLELKEDLELITGDVQGKPGFDNFIPLNPMESSLMDDPKFNGIKPITYWRDKQLPEIHKNIGERAFLVGDYTMMNGLTAWRSRYGLSDVPGNATNPILSSDITNRPSSYNWTRSWGRLTDNDLMRQYGKIDGINAVNSIVETLILTQLQTQLQDDAGKKQFKQNIIDKLSLKPQTFNEWVSSDPSGASATEVEKSLKISTEYSNTGYFNDITTTNIYTYSPDIIIGEKNNSILITPNPHEHNNFIILDSLPTRSITLEGPISNAATSKDSPFYDNKTNGYNKGLSTYEKNILEIDGTSFFKLDETTRVPTTTDAFKLKFLELGPWADDNYVNDKINYDFGGINWIDGVNDKGIEFGEPWSTPGKNWDALIQTPLWVKNLPTSKTYKRIQSTTYIQTSQAGLHSNTEVSYKALAYLALITLGWSDNDRGYAGWYDSGTVRFDGEGDNNYTSIPFFKMTGGQVKVPKGFTLITGAVLWRLRESNYLSGGDTNPSTTEGILSKQTSGVDPIIWWNGGGPTTLTPRPGETLPSGVAGTVANTKGLSGYKKLEPYHWPHVINPSVASGQKYGYEWIKAKSMTLPDKNSSYVDYVDMRVYMKNLLLLPNNVKEAFIEKFETWALGNWKSKYLPAFDPLSFGSTNNAFDFYSSAGTIRRFGPKNGLGDDEKNNVPLNEMYSEVFENYDILAFSTPKVFNAISKKDFRNSFNLREKEFDSFLDGWIEGFNATVTDKITAKQSGEDSDELTGQNALNDDDIKLNLYRSFKSIFDKWIASSSKGSGSYELFYNKVSNNTDKSRLLLDHFQFVDRGFNNIGNQAVIDITILKSMAENPTTSLYQTIAEMLSKNNFDFFPLPSFVPYGKDQKSQDALKDMFTPVTTLDNVESSPSFICMYVGGASRNLDIGHAAQAFCNNKNQIEYNYEDDAVDDMEKTDAENLVKGNVTAFLVSYGIENQSHFKSISLDQAEFKETQESLMVIDQLAKGGNENNRVSKGQNLYNIYQTRSYTCEVEAMGNMQIQPMMYFQLTNVPMFHGSYIITEVKHSIKPHFVTTTFKGTRVPRVTVPIVTDVYSTMVLGETDLKKSSGSVESVLGGIRNNSSSNTSTTWGTGTPGETIDLTNQGKPPSTSVIKGDNSNQTCPTHPRISDGGVGEAYINGDKYKIRLCKVKDTSDKSGKVNVSMALNLAKMMDKAKADGIPLTIGSNFRTMDEQIATAKGNGCYKSGSFVYDDCSPNTATPGKSNHQSGTAIDFGCGGNTICYKKNSEWCAKNGSTQKPDQYPCFKWMVENANNFSYYNYKNEAWHWSATGG